MNEEHLWASTCLLILGVSSILSPTYIFSLIFLHVELVNGFFQLPILLIMSYGAFIRLNTQFVAGICQIWELILSKNKNKNKIKITFLSLSYILYFNLIHNISILSIWFLIFQYHVNIVIAIIFWMKINNVFNGQNNKLVFVDVRINKNFILTICQVRNFYPVYNSRD